MKLSLSSDFRLNLSRESVEQGVTAIRIALLFCSCSLFALLQREAIFNYLTASGLKLRIPREGYAVAPSQLTLRTKSERHDYSVIQRKQIFGAPPPPPPPPPAVKPPSDVSLRLVGIFMTEGVPPSAIIENSKTKEQDAFGLSEELFATAKLVSINPESVTIETNGVKETLPLEGGTVGAVQSPASTGSGGPGQEITVAEAEIDQALANLPLLLTQARAVPYFQEGKAVGLRMFAIKTGSLFEKIGLRNGDILHSVNGENLGDFSKAMSLFEKLKAERSIRVELTRNREQQVFLYQVR